MSIQLRTPTPVFKLLTANLPNCQPTNLPTYRWPSISNCFSSQPQKLQTPTTLQAKHHYLQISPQLFSASLSLLNYHCSHSSFKLPQPSSKTPLSPQLFSASLLNYYCSHSSFTIFRLPRKTPFVFCSPRPCPACASITSTSTSTPS